jgi:acetyl esterase/lipase
MNRFLLAPCVILLLLNSCAATEVPKSVAVRKNIAYGADLEQRMDVYLPSKPDHAPILFMVHGGGWRRGDKDNPGVVNNKVAHWVPQGVIFVSVNYRMIPEAEPLTQAEDVAHALAKVQELAPSWGGDPANIVIMGHSAGAHLVALIDAAPEIAAAQGAKPWKGAVVLDSGAMNVPAIMTKRHPSLYDEAFGDNPSKWRAASPFHRLTGPIAPALAVCRKHSDWSCPPNRAFATKARSLGNQVDVLPIELTHGEINSELGLPGPYTERVDAFLRGLGWKL